MNKIKHTKPFKAIVEFGKSKPEHKPAISMWPVRGFQLPQKPSPSGICISFESNVRKTRQGDYICDLVEVVVPVKELEKALEKIKTLENW